MRKYVWILLLCCVGCSSGDAGDLKEEPPKRPSASETLACQKNNGICPSPEKEGYQTQTQSTSVDQRTTTDVCEAFWLHSLGYACRKV